MKITDISEIDESMEGMILPAVSGTLTSLFKQMTGTTKDGKPWALQNGELAHEGSKIKLCFASREPMPESLRGQAVTIESQKTKHGMQGVKVSINEYKGKRSLELRITGSAIVSFPNAQLEGVSEVQDGEQDFSPVKVPEKAQNSPQPHPSPKNGLSGESKARHRMMQYANLYSMAHGAAAFLAEHNGWERSMTKDVASCFFIQATREALTELMPNDGPIGPKQPKMTPEDIYGKEDFDSAREGFPE